MATNLVAGDTNAQADVFLWSRPRGSAGLTLTNPGDGLRRVSVTSSGGEANGASTNPSLDGSTRTTARCVAFQSTASNLAGGDRDTTSDVYVRDLRRNRTILISRGIGGTAIDPSIDGRCRHVAFEANGAVYDARVSGGRPHRIASGTDPDYSLDGSALAFVHRGSVFLRRTDYGHHRAHTSKVGPGGHPTVGDDDSGKWAISFDTTSKLTRKDDNPGSDVYMRILKTRGGPRATDLISAPRRGASSLGGDSHNGGISAYAGTRGIVVFVNDAGSESTLYYRNNHSGNIDDLAHATTTNPIFDVVSSARSNFVAFSSRTPFVGHTGPTQAVFFKHLIDGEAI